MIDPEILSPLVLLVLTVWGFASVVRAGYKCGAFKPGDRGEY